jgi:SPP1 gp7 family putative phage head morphogenesis protein
MMKPILTCGTTRDTSLAGQRQRAMDARAKRIRGQPKIGRATENFERSLGQVGEHIGHLIDAFPAAQRAGGNEELVNLLHAYGQVLRPWAKKASARMIEEVNARDVAAWREISKNMRSGLAHEIRNTQVGAVMAKLMAEQTELIAALPVEAAQRVQRLTLTGLIEGEQLGRIVAEIERSGEVSAAHARMIARTEVSRTASNLTEARAAVAGLPLYRWRATKDKKTRPNHAAMDGKICEWANPPEIDEGGRLMRFHPGCIWECRCWAEIIT